MEFRRKCKVCGKIYCYSEEDLKKNSVNASMAAISAIGGLASLFGGTRLDTYALNNQTDRYSDKVIDYTKCPYCNSENTLLLLEADYLKMQQEEADKNAAASQPQIVETKRIEINSNATVDSLLKRTEMFLEEEEWEKANAYCEQILDIDPECAMAYVYQLMNELHVTTQEGLAQLESTFSDRKLYQKAIRFADADLKSLLEGYNNAISDRNNEKAYKIAFIKYRMASSEIDYIKASDCFKELGNFKDSSRLAEECQEKAVIFKYNHAKELFQNAKTEEDFLASKKEFEELDFYADSKELASNCADKAIEAKNNAIYDAAVLNVSSENETDIEAGIGKFELILDWQDSIFKKTEAEEKLTRIKKKKKRKKVITWLVVVFSVVACVMAAIIFVNVKKNKEINEYNRKVELYQIAISYYEKGDYSAAEEIFKDIGDYSDSIELSNACK